ncbi:uncharacterized protein BHQ10_008313 [Talaromyces amestolkiae]|uniref:Uncharacterized protein n=1 Tax=Talaromyces amestolkiae TaxID=1196081 RepID=A0A364L9C0_TALAM|nr:uncharacterized protein BHQ10_008313 [Talaromyces amestolkiae]RAO72301.1 hypothetical protein BHQ10_008313 [Talaromyces amestolkiae]
MDSLTTFNKSAPVLVSTSLEGLEIGVPPPTRLQAAWLDKPLPSLPDRTSSVYGTESTIDLSGCIEKSLDHDDLLALGRNRSKSDVDSDVASTRFYYKRNVANRKSLNTRTSERYSIGFKAFLTEEQYGVGMHLARANHYFREKKWEIFPELGPQAAGRDASSPTATKSPRRGRPRLPKGFSKQQLCQGEVFGISLRPVAEHMKPVIEHIRPVVNHMKAQTENLKPVASHIQHTLVTKTSRLRLRMMSVEEKEEEEGSAQTVAQLSRNFSSSSSKDSDRTLVNHVIEPVESPETSSPAEPSFATVRQRMRDMSPWIVTTRSELKGDSIALWKSTSTTVLNIVSHAENKLTAATMTRSRSCSQPSPAHGLRQYTSSASVDTSSANKPLPIVRVVTEKPILSIQTHFHASSPTTTERGGVSKASIPDYARHIRAKSKSKTKDTMVFVAAAYDGAKQKIADVQAARRRAGMKKQIRLVGPIDQYPDGSINQRF